MAKKITVNGKLIKKIDAIVAEKLCLSKVDEFQDTRPEKPRLFEDRPEHWIELENQLFEYTERVRAEIMNDIKDLLVNGNAR